MATSKNTSTNVKSLSKQLSSVASQAKSLGINTSKADAMVAQTKSQGSKSFAGSSVEKDYNAGKYGTPVVNATQIGQTTPAPVTTPTTPSPTFDYASLLNAAGIDAKSGFTPTDTTQTTPTSTTPNSDMFNTAMQMLKLKSAPPSLADTYDAMPEKKAFERAQQAKNAAAEQLNTVLTKQQMDLTQARTAASTNGVTEAVYGGISNEINREALMQALPLQAQLAAAQDDLQMAQQHLDTMFQIKSQDIQAMYKYRSDTIDSLTKYMTDEQQRRADAVKLADANAREDKQFNMGLANQWAMKALEYGQSTLAGKIMALDPKSSTYSTDLVRLTGQIVKPVSATSTKRDTQIVNGKLIDMQTGEVISNLTNPTSSALGHALTQGKIENVTSILNNSAIGSAVGPSSLARTEPGLWGAAKRFFTGALTGALGGGALGTAFGGVGAIPGAIIGGITTGVVNATRGSMAQLTGDRQAFIGATEQLRSELTVDKLAQAKGQGVTFGALSDGERGLIANAATKLGTWAKHEDNDINKPVIGYNVSEKDFKREIDTINYFQKLDAVLQGSTPESVGAVRQSDGTYWVANSDGTLSQLILNR